MKFKDLETGKVYNDIMDAKEELCEGRPFYGRLLEGDKTPYGDFSMWAREHPEAAAYLMGLKVIRDDDQTETERPTREFILEAARSCVCGDRDRQYGSPENSFKVIAEFWEAYLRAKCVSAGENVCVNPEDVAAMMVLFKIARVATVKGKADNWVDAVGYAACGGEIEGNA